MRREPPWKKLAAELSEFGVESPYLDRVRSRVDPEQELKALEDEIAGEIASALGRTEERLNLALAELDLCKARFEAARVKHAPHHELVTLADAFNAQRKVAEQSLRNLTIHREAAGFRRNQILFELYPIPPKLTP
jgi:hypothetical protein